MSRTKSVLLVFLLTALVGILPMAQAAVTVEVTIAGSSAMWQTLALAAFAEAGTGAGHWTSASSAIFLTDTRLGYFNDFGSIWVVWNSDVTKVWSFFEVDSVAGVRCYFAQPHCNVNATLSNLSGSGSGQISSVLWGADSALPANVQSLFTTGQLVTVAATDIRPEDANFAACRANSQLGAGSVAPPGTSDGLDGLGYNTNWAPGVCATSGSDLYTYGGNHFKSGYPGSTATAGNASFNIKGNDPISGDPIPSFTVVEVGASPLIFITERATALASLTNATDGQLQQVFSGTNCDASAFGLPAGGINIFLQTPSDAAEATIFRKPAVYPGAILGISQEANVGANNPLAGQSGTCVAGGGARYRGIGTGEEVKSVHDSSTKYGNGFDGIGYTFFSYGNVSSIANNRAYGYIQLEGVDPIFASYSGGDPGEPGNGTIPGAANLPSSCDHAFPCPESDIWTGALSFPNLRNGTYPAWSTLRLVSNGTPLTAAKALVTKSQAFVVSSVPDYVPFLKTKAGTITDPGLTIVRSHYQQYDGAGNLLGAAPINSGELEAGGDMGGYIFKSTVKTTQEVNGDGFVEVARPANP